MTTAVRMEMGCAAIVVLTLPQFAFRPITQNMLYAPFAFFTVPSAAASVRPAFSASLVFTAAHAFEMAPENDSIEARGTGIYTIAGTITHISLRLTGLVPHAAYAVECARNTPCSLIKSSVTADRKGRASFAIDRALLKDTTAETATILRVMLHNKDGGAPEPQLSYSLPVTEFL